MATVSSDQRLKVFDLNDEGEWVISESFRAHDASINRVCGLKVGLFVVIIADSCRSSGGRQSTAKSLRPAPMTETLGYGRSRKWVVIIQTSLEFTLGS